jgi:peptidoglycan/LPS O-acetylase OafA/YrhL
LVTAIALPVQKDGLLFFFNEFPTFMVGYSLYLLIHRDEKLLTGLCLLILSFTGLYFKHGFAGHIFIAITLSVLITINSRKPLKDNFFSQLGDFSYSIYLIHVPVGIYLLGFIKNQQLVQKNISLNITADFLILVLVIFLSRMMYLKIELPSINLGRKLSRSYLKTQFLNAKQLLSP